MTIMNSSNATVNIPAPRLLEMCIKILSDVVKDKRSKGEQILEEHHQRELCKIQNPNVFTIVRDFFKRTSKQDKIELLDKKITLFTFALKAGIECNDSFLMRDVYNDNDLSELYFLLIHAKNEVQTVLNFADTAKHCQAQYVKGLYNNNEIALSSDTYNRLVYLSE